MRTENRNSFLPIANQCQGRRRNKNSCLGHPQGNVGINLGMGILGENPGRHQQWTASSSFSSLGVATADQSCELDIHITTYSEKVCPSLTLFQKRQTPPQASVKTF